MYFVVMGCLFFLIGGGVFVVMNLFNVMVFDVSIESDRWVDFKFMFCLLLIDF